MAFAPDQNDKPSRANVASLRNDSDRLSFRCLFGPHVLFGQVVLLGSSPWSSDMAFKILPSRSYNTFVCINT